MEELILNEYILGGMMSVIVLFAIILFGGIHVHKILVKKQVETFSKVILATESESRKIGQNLHDDFGPYLAAVRMNLSGIDSLLNKEDAQLLEDSMEKLSVLLQLTRSFSHDLCSVELTENTISEVFEKRKLSIEASGMWKVNLKTIQIIDGFNELNQKVLFRILNECLKNSMIHSKGNEVWIICEQLNNQFYQITYRDNGIGVTDNQNSYGLGLSGILSRAELLNAKVEMNKGGWNGFELKLKLKHDEC